MDLTQIKALIDVMAASDLAELGFSQDGWSLRLVRRPADAVFPVGVLPAPAAAAAAIAAVPEPMPVAVPAADGVPHKVLLAPLYGIVHLRPSPEEPPFVQVGQAVQAGQTVCVVEAMKVFNTVQAERAGTVAAVLVGSGQEVDAGQPLLRFA